eukprot:2833113-Pyramimonas_sp.AAC.2
MLEEDLGPELLSAAADSEAALGLRDSAARLFHALWEDEANRALLGGAPYLSRRRDVKVTRR